MKWIKIKNSSLDNFLNPKLTLEERGLIITIMTAQKEAEGQSEITWLYFEKSLKIKQNIRLHLVNLQEQGIIEYSLFKSHKKALEQDKYSEYIKEVIEYSNTVLGTNRRLGKTLSDTIRPRLVDHSMEDIKLVIGNRKEIWQNDPVMKEHLCLETLMRPKNFVKYLAQAQSSGIGKTDVSVDAIKDNVKMGDIFNLDNINFLDNDTIYPIKIYESLNGVLVGSGRRNNVAGVNIKKIVKGESIVKNPQIIMYWKN